VACPAALARAQRLFLSGGTGSAGRLPP
jgi:hypothetical protein